jgi:hypothetical protein
MTIFKLLTFGSIIAILVTVLSGCTSAGSKPTTVELTTQQKVQEIQNNASMPPQAKAAAIGAIEASAKPKN